MYFVQWITAIYIYLYLYKKIDIILSVPFVFSFLLSISFHFIEITTHIIVGAIFLLCYLLSISIFLLYLLFCLTYCLFGVGDFGRLGMGFLVNINEESRDGIFS